MQRPGAITLLIFFFFIYKAKMPGRKTESQTSREIKEVINDIRIELIKESK